MNTFPLATHASKFQASNSTHLVDGIVNSMQVILLENTVHIAKKNRKEHMRDMDFQSPHDEKVEDIYLYADIGNCLYYQTKHCTSLMLF